MSSLSTKETKAKLRRMTVKEFNDELLNLKTIIHKMEKLDIIRQQQLIEKDKIYDEIEELKELIKNLTILSAKNNIEEEIKLIHITRKKISGLKGELECKQDLIVQEEFETGAILSELYFKKLKALDELSFKEIKLEKLGLSKIAIDAIKKSSNLSNLSWWDCFNN